MVIISIFTLLAVSFKNKCLQSVRTSSSPSSVGYHNHFTWTSWRLKSPAIPLFFFQQCVQAYSKKNIKGRYYSPLWWESTGGLWIPLAKEYIYNGPATVLVKGSIESWRFSIYIIYVLVALNQEAWMPFCAFFCPNQDCFMQTEVQISAWNIQHKYAYTFYWYWDTLMSVWATRHQGMHVTG